MKKNKNKNKKSKNRNFYKKYIRSSLWGIRKFLAIKKANNACENCFKDKVKLSVHHLNYENFGNESIDDLMVLCDDCHHILDKDKRSKRWSFCSNHRGHPNILESYQVCCIQCLSCLLHCNCKFFINFSF